MLLLYSSKIIMNSKELSRHLKIVRCSKANEWEMILLYLLPVMLSSLLKGENKDSDIQDLVKLVFSPRYLYETSMYSKVCDALIKEFCRSMEKKYQKDKFDHMNYHLLRHLACKLSCQLLLRQPLCSRTRTTTCSPHSRALLTTAVFL